MLNLGNVSVDQTVHIPFHTFDSAGASVTITGLALADIKVYKDGGVTQRSSTAGFSLLDTDGIDFDAMTGIHGISIDLSDNTDAGFYAAGSDYWVVIDNITVNSQTVRFVAAVFSIENRAADVVAWNGTAVTESLLTSKDIGRIYRSTITTVNSQTSFDCATAIALDDNWIGLVVHVLDVSAGDVAVRWVTDIDQANDRVIINQAPGFTVTSATPDEVIIFGYMHPQYVTDTLGVNAVKLNGVNVDGSGVEGDLWRGAVV